MRDADRATMDEGEQMREGERQRWAATGSEKRRKRAKEGERR